MGYDSKNMHYIFHIEYFDGMDLVESRKSKEKTYIDLIKQKNKDIFDFEFPESELFEELKGLEEYHEFSLYTMYPGLLAGIGNPHQIAEPEAVKLGFNFDFVTGLPYISGSSLKGMLRSMFPEEHKKNREELTEMIRGFLGKGKEFDVAGLVENIFEEGEDVFLGGHPVVSDGKGKILQSEYVTPHLRKFKNPIPISFLKVAPDVCFKFCYLLKDYKNGEDVVTAEEKAGLFRELILLAGIGAKTNVGFGRFSEKKAGRNIREQSSNEKRRFGV